MFQSVGKDLLIVTACKNQPYCRFKIHLYQKVYIFAVIKFVGKHVCRPSTSQNLLPENKTQAFDFCREGCHMDKLV